MQEEGYKKYARAPIVQSWEEMTTHLPVGWGARRKGFLAWLAGPAGLLVDRTDGTLSFTHLSFQEFLVAWHLQATVEGDERRRLVCNERMRRDNWWETLRLWGALVEGRNPTHLKPVMLSLLGDEDRGMWLVGAML